MPVLLDFSGVPEAGSGFELWPVGEPIQFTIFKIELKQNKNGDAMYSVQFKHIDSNRRAFTNFNLTAQGLPYFKSFLLNLGVDSDELEGSFEFEPTEFLGYEVVLTFKAPTEYNGKEYQNVSTISASGI